MTKRDSSEHGKTDAAMALEYAIARGVPEAVLCLRYKKTRRQLREFIDGMAGSDDVEYGNRRGGRKTA